MYLITIDTLRADHVHAYGDEDIQTPALDDLARHGIRFAQAFTPSPITNSSHASILTGLLPSGHGVTDFARPLVSESPTWAEALKKRGYQTAAFIGAVILDSKALAPGLDRGFDFYDNFPERSQTKSRWGRVERRGTEVVRRAEAWQDAHPMGPHFVWVHLYDPHDPYEPPAPYSTQYKDRLYDGEIAFADSALANFVGHLKQRGRYDNSLIIVVGDHGEGLGEHHEQTHGIFLYDSTLHVPLILKLPGRSAGSVIQSQVRTTDILPTVLDLLSIPSPQTLDGQSLQPYLSGKESDSRTLFGETDYPLHFGWAPLRAVRAEGFKFVEAPRPELYDLHADPGELKNTYAPWDATVQKLRKILADERAQKPPMAPSEGTVGVGTLDELRALGYLGPADSGSSTNVPEPSMLPDPKDKIEQQNLLHSAMMAAEDGRYSDAQVGLEKVLALDPSFADRPHATGRAGTACGPVFEGNGIFEARPCASSGRPHRSVLRGQSPGKGRQPDGRPRCSAGKRTTCSAPVRRRARAARASLSGAERRQSSRGPIRSCPFVTARKGGCADRNRKDETCRSEVCGSASATCCRCRSRNHEMRMYSRCWQKLIQGWAENLKRDRRKVEPTLYSVKGKRPGMIKTK